MLTALTRYAFYQDETDVNLPLGIPSQVDFTIRRRTLLSVNSTWWVLNNFALRIFYTILCGNNFNIVTRRALAHRVLLFNGEDVWWMMDNSHINHHTVCPRLRG